MLRIYLAEHQIEGIPSIIRDNYIITRRKPIDGNTDTERQRSIDYWFNPTIGFNPRIEGDELVKEIEITVYYIEVNSLDELMEMLKRAIPMDNWVGLFRYQTGRGEWHENYWTIQDRE